MKSVNCWACNFNHQPKEIKMKYLDKFFNSVAGRILSAIAVGWTLFEIFKHLKQKHDDKKNIVDVEPK